MLNSVVILVFFCVDVFCYDCACFAFIVVFIGFCVVCCLSFALLCSVLGNSVVIWLLFLYLWFAFELLVVDLEVFLLALLLRYGSLFAICLNVGVIFADCAAYCCLILVFYFRLVVCFDLMCFDCVLLAVSLCCVVYNSVVWFLVVLRISVIALDLLASWLFTVVLVNVVWFCFV